MADGTAQHVFERAGLGRAPDTLTVFGIELRRTTRHCYSGGDGNMLAISVREDVDDDQCGDHERFLARAHVEPLRPHDLFAFGSSYEEAAKELDRQLRALRDALLGAAS